MTHKNTLSFNKQDYFGTPTFVLISMYVFIRLWNLKYNILSKVK